MNTLNKNYVVGISIISFLVFLTYLNEILRPHRKFITRTVVLKADPKYDFKTYKGSDYWIDLYFYGTEDKFEIGGGFYQYLNHPIFLKEVKKDSTITITYADGFIEQLSKNNFDYIDREASLKHIAKNTLSARVIFITALITTLLPFLFRKIINEDTFLSISKNFGVIIIVILIITCFVTCQYIGPKYLDATWTKYPVERRRS